MSLERNTLPLFFAMFGFAFFAFVNAWHAQQSSVSTPEFGLERVVVSAPILVVLYGGDRFLAANLETVRLAATSTDSNDMTDSNYLVRAQLVVAKLNACHEDNYYLANGLLTWGGMVDEGNDILRRAIGCRFWDGVPPFFYGVNRSFFDYDVDEAMRAFEISAERWPENSSTLRRMAIMLRAESFNDALLALEYLQQQRDSTRDPRLRDLLGLRIMRLQGLIELRAAKQRYELKHGVLSNLQQLVMSGELTELPVDPLQLGYELRDNKVELSRLEIVGMESRP